MSQRSHVLADDLSDHIRGRILAGEYRPGEAIAETVVAAEYGVARPSARSALDRLVSDGILVRQAHAALRVRAVSPSEIPEILALLTFFEARALGILSTGSADLRALRASADDSLHKYLHTLVEASGDARLTQFHRQTTFALLLVQTEVPPVDASPVATRDAKERLTNALFSLDTVGAERCLHALWDARTARLPIVQSVR